MTNKALPRELAVEQYFARQDALTARLSDADIPAVAHRYSQGWYAANQCTNVIERCLAFRALLPQETVFCDATAAILYGLPTPPLRDYQKNGRLHVNIAPPARRVRRKELILHRKMLDPEDSIVDSHGIPLVTPERLYVDAALAWGSDFTVALGDALLRTGLSSVRRLVATTRRLRSVKGVFEAGRLIAFLDDRAQSLAESVIRFRLTHAGYFLLPQCPVTDSHGEIFGHADLGDPALKLAIEYEGAHHSESGQFAYDIERYSNFAAAGWHVIRCGRRDLLGDSSKLIHRVGKFMAKFHGENWEVLP